MFLMPGRVNQMMFVNYAAQKINSASAGGHEAKANKGHELYAPDLIFEF